MKGKAIALLGLYLDDILMVAAGICFVTAAGLMAGAPAALGTAGIWLTVCAFVVAQAKKRGGA